MKRTIFFSLLIALFSLTAAAQESAPELANAGNAAYAEKDYATAVEKWEAYLAHPDATVETTDSYTYKVAEAARKADQIDKARQYYQKCIDLDYKADMCMFKLGSSYKEEDPEKYISYMEKCVTNYPKSKYYKKYFLPSVTIFYNKAASDIFNNATAAQQEATASGDAEKYVSIMETKALPLFDEAEAAFNKTLKFDETDATATNAIANINTQREAFKAYQAELAAQKK